MPPAPSPDPNPSRGTKAGAWRGRGWAWCGPRSLQCACAGVRRSPCIHAHLWVGRKGLYGVSSQPLLAARLAAQPQDPHAGHREWGRNHDFQRLPAGPGSCRATARCQTAATPHHPVPPCSTLYHQPCLPLGSAGLCWAPSPHWAHVLLRGKRVWCGGDGDLVFIFFLFCVLFYIFFSVL